MIRLGIKCWPRVKHAAPGFIKHHHAHGLTRHVHRVGHAVAQNKAAVLVCTVVAGGSGWLAGGMPGWASAPPVERHGHFGTGGRLHEAPAPLAYLPPEAIPELPPGPLFLPPLALPPEAEIIGPPMLVPELPVVPQEMQPPAIQFPPGQPPQPVPEPSSLLLLATALVAMLAKVRS